MRAPTQRGRGAALAAASLALLSFSPARAELEADLRFLPAYFSGDYGAGVRIRTLYVPAILVLSAGRHEVRVTVPYVYLSTEEPVFFVGDHQFARRGGGGRTVESGPGDVVAQEEYFFLAGGRGRPWVSAILRAKLPTGDESKGLGTGEPDFGGGFGLIQPLGDRWHLLGQYQYIVRGDPPDFDFRNTRWWSLGLQRRLSDASSATLFYDRRQSVFPGDTALADVSLGYDRSLARRVTLRAAVFAGLSRTAEDYGVSAGFSVH